MTDTQYTNFLNSEIEPKDLSDQEFEELLESFKTNVNAIKSKEEFDEFWAKFKQTKE